MLPRCSKFLLSLPSSKNLPIVVNNNAAAGQLLRLFSSTPSVGAVKGVLCPRPQETINKLGKKYCKFKESTNKCPQSAKLECPQPCPNRPCENEVKNPAEAFREAMEDVSCKATSLVEFTRSKTEEILADLDAKMIEMSKDQLALRSKYLAEIEQKVDEVEKLSFKCGHRRRNEGYSIGLRINEKIQNWECENIAGRLGIRLRLAKLADCVRERTDTLVRLVRTCRGSCSRQDMLKCIGETHHNALCIYDHASHHAREEIKQTELAKNRALDENRAEADKFMNKFEKQARGFVKQLDMEMYELDKLCKKKDREKQVITVEK